MVVTATQSYTSNIGIFGILSSNSHQKKKNMWGAYVKKLYIRKYCTLYIHNRIVLEEEKRIIQNIVDKLCTTYSK